MKKMCCIVLMWVLLASNMHGMTGVEGVEKYYRINSVSVSPTNWVLRFKSSSFSVEQNGTQRHSSEYIANNEDLVLTPDKDVWLVAQYGKALFTPVIFKNQQKGIKFMEMAPLHHRPGELFTNFVMYTVLGDTPAEVTGEDVEMIMLDGKWEKAPEDAPPTPFGPLFLLSSDDHPRPRFKRPENEGNGTAEPLPIPKDEGGVQETPPIPEEPVTATQDETPITVAEYEQSEGKSKASNGWLYVVIALCTLSAVFYFLRMKKANQ